MSRKPSPAVRTTLYRLTAGLRELSDGVRNKYLELDTFNSLATEVAGHEALVVVGWMQTEQVKWAGTLRGLTGEDVTLGNQVAAGVLLIRDGNEAWALTYGMGFHLLEQNYLDANFGQRIAIRIADPNELSSLTRATLDQRARIDRSSIPSGDHLRGFGFGGFGELVTRLAGKARLPELTDPAETINVRGADSLSLPLGRSADHLLHDLEVLKDVLARPVLPDLEPLEQLTMVKHNPELIAALEAHLEDAIEAPDDKMIGLSWPHEQIDENGTPNAFRLQGVGRRAAGPHPDLPSLDHLLASLRDLPIGQRVDRSRRVKVLLLGDEEGEESVAVSSAIPVIKWLAFETDHDDRRYFLHNGNWYLMDQDYATRLRSQTKEILSVSAGFTMPAWPEGMDEATYNVQAAGILNGVVLDRKLLRTSFHARGIELCDILLPDGTLIHVKKIRRSDAASHHIAQALVSTDALLYDQEASRGFAQLVVDNGGESDWRPDRLKRVVLAMARPGSITEHTLLTFTQVTLARNVAPLRAKGVEVFVVPIKLES